MGAALGAVTGGPRDRFPARFLLGLLLVTGPGWVAPAAAVTAAVRADATWSGVVEVRGDVTVLPDVTLTLLPGTVVRVAKEWNATEGRGPLIDVRGTLVARGTASEPIVFRSAEACPGPGDWGGIAFHKARGEVSRMTNCRVEHATAGIQGGGSRVFVEDSQFAGNEVGAALFEGLEARFVRCRFRENDTGAVLHLNRTSHLEQCRIDANRRAGVLSTSSSLSLVDCRIEGNGGVGVECSKGSSGRVSGTLVEGHDRGVVVSWRSDTEIQDCVIRGNRVGVWAEKEVAPPVTGNEISGNQIGVYCNWAARPRLRGNDIFGNARYAVVLGDNLSAAAEKALPARGPAVSRRGRTAAPGAGGALRGTGQAAEAEGFVDAVGNWWGGGPSAEMEAKGADGNIGAFDDGRDKPTVEYVGPGGERTGLRYPRDRVRFAPWSGTPLRR